MTVIEAIRKYNLEDIDKEYVNILGERRDVSFPLDELARMEVKGVCIDVPSATATITLQTVR